MKNNKLEITAEKVREAASRCSTTAQTLKMLFPEAFESDLFHFGDEIRISPSPTRTDTPLFIGRGLAPNDLESKCLIVSSDWEMKTQIYDGRTVLTFHKK